MSENLAAVVQKMEYLNVRGASFVVWIYDKDRPRAPEADDPCARYESVEMLGPFRSMGKAVSAAEARIGATSERERFA